MGDAAVAALVKEVMGRLTYLAIQEFDLLRRLKDDILTLKDDFTEIQAVIQDAEEKCSKEKRVELWLQRLRSASLMVENVLDEVSTEALLQSLRKQRVRYRVRSFFSSNHNQLMSHVRIAHKIKDIRRKLDDISSMRFELKLTPLGTISREDVEVAGEMPNRETSSLVHDSLHIVGRNEEVEMVTKKICNKDIGKHENSEIRVYGIWGMGGLGKTTLAQLVYNHERVNQYFELKCWMYVSEKFQVKEIIKGIIESIDEKECTLTHLDVLQKSLQDRLRGKKFLVVLDDVWIEDDEKAKWDELSETLSCGAEESIVLMTTRSKTTSQMMAMVRELQHELGCLSEDDSWLLFKKFAFAGREVDDISELEHIGKEIVTKCKRLPLAVKTIGSLMWSKRSTRDWEHVKDNILWNLQEHNVLPALKLSYDNLLPHLRRCYTYCCLFPKGYHMIKDEVIWLWVSNGFIPRKGEISLYVLGEEVFNCLVWRSFFQVEKADGFMDSIDRYKMHDLMYDMAQYVMRHDCLVIGSAYKEIKIPDELLHLSSSCENFSCEESRKLRSLRSIFVFGKVENASSITQISNHMYLRVLYLCNTWLRTLPESICKLKHLRYLNLSDSDIQVLPESIIFLQNLQVLVLCSCKRLRKLPEGLIYMRNLQRLDINYCNSLEHLPCGISELTSLRMLSQFLVCKESGAKIKELRGLNLLEGNLEISGLENVGGLTEAKSVNLKCITNLSVLKLSWSYMVGERERHEEVLEGLEPNPYLKGLIIFQYMGKIISPSWMVSLRNLVEITFHWCKNCEHIPPLGGLPNLRVLHLVRMFSLKYFHDEDTNMSEDITNRFLSLQELHIVHCESLVSLPCKLPKLEVLKMKECWGLISLPADLPSITKLHLVACDRLRSLPDEILKDLNELVIDSKHLSKRCEKEMGEDWPKISHIPNIRISSTR